MQGRAENILTSTDKMFALQQRIKIWKTRASKGNLEMFPLTAKTNHKDILELILKHLDSLHCQINHYFPSLSIEKYDWVRNPFVEASSEDQFTLDEQEQLAELFNNRTLKLKHSEENLNTFWIGVGKVHPNISQKAQIILLQFSTTYLCELGFSALATVKNTKRERLLTVEDELRVCLSKIRPRIQQICKNNQAQVSH
jgi:hypothetical protein